MPIRRARSQSRSRAQHIPTTGCSSCSVLSPCSRLDTQTGLTLSYIALITAEIRTGPSSVSRRPSAQLLTLGKRKIRRAAPLPSARPDELERRVWGLVLHFVYLIFTEGYAATDHHDLFRCDLVDEAILLARILHRLMPGEPRVTGLLALMLLTDARRQGQVRPGHRRSLETRTAASGYVSMIDESQLTTQSLRHTHQQLFLQLNRRVCHDRSVVCS